MNTFIAFLILVGGHLDDPNHAWFESLHNQLHVPCCDVADGHRLSDVDWRGNADGTYAVRVDGKWTAVPPEAVIVPKDRPIDSAVVWIWGGQILCFMAGAGT